MILRNAGIDRTLCHNPALCCDVGKQPGCPQFDLQLETNRFQQRVERDHNNHRLPQTHHFLSFAGSFAFTAIMSNLPSQPRPSQPQSPSESWHTVPSSNSSSDHDIAVDQGSSTEDLIDLNPTTALAQSQPGQTSNEGPARLPASEKKKCWICLAEEGELSPDGAPVTNSRWAKACACSLDAHESCLIAWINQSRGGDATKTVSSCLPALLTFRWCVLNATNLTNYSKMYPFSTKWRCTTINASISSLPSLPVSVLSAEPISH